MNQESLSGWLDRQRVTEVECIVPDMTGIARGKIVPRDKYDDVEGLRLPEVVLLQTVTGNYPDDDEDYVAPVDPDMVLMPDPSTARLVPWALEPTAVLIHDCYKFDGTPVDLSPRNVLRRVLSLYRARGWEPVVAPEMEFYLVTTNPDPDLPLEPPVGRTGRSETGRQAYSVDAVNEFDPVFEDIYAYCETQELKIETLIHEVGVAQMEINFSHGDPLALADQVFLFKRIVREVAIRHSMYATFMAKPMEGEPGSAMHLHQSVVGVEGGGNLFSRADGEPSALFLHFLGGQQHYLPKSIPFFAPYVNSYRRLTRFSAAPINVRWGYDNRTCGLRVPHSGPAARRVENRLPGVDCNPYIAIAASLAAGYLGMVEERTPTPPLATSAYGMPYELPRHLDDAIEWLRGCAPLAEVLGERFVRAYCSVKEAEYEEYARVISPWERRHLLLHV